ncbi:MAG: type 1 glutamine amidotransferase domain-containing protein, partial [Ilumatobacter sp.]
LEEFGDKGPDTLTPDAVDASDFDAIFYVGGHGTMWDFPDNDELSAIASSIYTDGGVVAAVCHGPAGLLNIEIDGEKLIAGKRVAGFTNAEEYGMDLSDVVPFLLEDELKAAGADHRAGPDFEENVVVDGRLVTGQNPPSATGVATAVVAAVRAVQAVAVADV